jgi:hypothetical protein
MWLCDGRWCDYFSDTASELLESDAVQRANLGVRLGRKAIAPARKSKSSNARLELNQLDFRAQDIL